MDEFREFNKYLAYMESQGAHRAGVAKVNIYNVEEKCSPIICILLITTWPFYYLILFPQMVFKE